MQEKLSKYAAKRDLEKSREPPAIVRRTGQTLMFTVQKHDASRLHYDLRLEHRGVLLSWAVPKGPSLDPAVKRLAVQVEDHPVSYGKFEGTIPANNYGAGTVLVWDFGTWEPRGDVDEMLNKGVLKFELKGKRLQGLWALIQMLNPKDWLLIKEKDGTEVEGDEDGLVRRYTTSALKEQAGKSVFNPESFRPQLATMTASSPTGNAWIHEVKFDGYRVLVWRLGDVTKLMTRSGLDWAERFPELTLQLSKILPSGVTVDGEVVVFDSQGRSDFSLLQHRLKDGSGNPPVFVAFDLLIFEGASIMNRPLIERKRVLQSLIKKPLQFSDHIEGKGEDLFNSACGLNLEGIVSKRKDAPYEQFRTKAWLKRKCSNRQEFVIGGFSKGKGNRGALGAILLGQFTSDGCFTYCGKVGSGFEDKVLLDLWNSLTPLTVGEKPFNANLKKLPQQATWVLPKVVVEIRYAERTLSGLIRHGVFMGTREEKSPADVYVEMTTKPNPISNVKITHPDRVLFEESGITKAELASYYESIAEIILPFIANRPLAVVRCPDGIEGDCFFQKHVGAGMPEYLGHKVAGQEEDMIVVRDSKDLLSLVQYGAIEVHPWGSKVSSIEKPDTMTFDLDPGPDVSWEGVVQATLVLRERLAALELPAFVKTSGGKGFHVVVPIHPGDLSWVEFKYFAKSIAEDMDRLVPGIFVTNMAKSKRKGRIFLDYLRNGRGSTSVAAFSVRSRPHAPVSMPIAWATVSTLSAANTYTVRNVGDWLAQFDPKVWDGYHNKAGRVTSHTWKLLERDPQPNLP